MEIARISEAEDAADPADRASNGEIQYIPELWAREKED